MTKCRRKGIGQTSDLGFRLLGTMILSEDGRNNDSEGSEELACAQNEHGKDALRFLKRVLRLFRVTKEGKQLAGEGGGVEELPEQRGDGGHSFRKFIYA